jgi:ABC-type transport system involved in cytochrome c biogenesis ATPase subunit
MGSDTAVQSRLVVRKVHLWRGEKHLLRGVSFEVNAGELLQVMGPNGVGKTSLLRCVAGLLPVESGEIE